MTWTIFFLGLGSIIGAVCFCCMAIPLLFEGSLSFIRDRCWHKFGLWEDHEPIKNQTRICKKCGILQIRNI